MSSSDVNYAWIIITLVKTYLMLALTDYNSVKMHRHTGWMAMTSDWKSPLLRPVPTAATVLKSAGSKRSLRTNGSSVGTSEKTCQISRSMLPKALKSKLIIGRKPKVRTMSFHSIRPHFFPRWAIFLVNK